MTGEHAIASGGFSDTWKASNEKGEVFAVKVLRLYQNNAAQVKKVEQCARFNSATGGRFLTRFPAFHFQKYSKEIIISRRTNHPNVLRIEGVALDLFPCCMVSRWMENGNMLDYLNRYRGPIDRLELVSIDPSCYRRTAHLHPLTMIASSYWASSAVWTTCISTKSFMET